MPRTPAFALALTLALGTCAADPPAFYNPATGAIADCTATELDPFLDQCVAIYERAGWLRVEGPIIVRESSPRSAAP